jgi:hypothetical protein
LINVCPGHYRQGGWSEPLRALGGTSCDPCPSKVALVAKSILRRLKLVEQALAELDRVTLEAYRPWQHELAVFLAKRPLIQAKTCRV